MATAERSPTAARPTPVAAEEVQRAAREAVEQPRSGGIVDMADFDATLYFLDDREIEYLQSEIVREYQQDLRVNISARCSTSSSRRPKSRSATRCSTIWKHSWCTCCRQDTFAASLESSASPRRPLRRAPDLTPEQRERLSHLADRLSSPDVLSQLIQSLDDASAIPPTREELEDLFDQLRPAALATVFQWLGKLQRRWRSRGARPARPTGSPARTRPS